MKSALTRIIITCESIEEAKKLASSKGLEYFKQNLVYSYLNERELEPHLEYPTAEEAGDKRIEPIIPKMLPCPRTGLIGKVDK